MLTKLKYLVVSCVLVGSVGAMASTTVVCPQTITCTSSGACIKPVGYDDWFLSIENVPTAGQYDFNMVDLNFAGGVAFCEYGPFGESLLLIKRPMSYVPLTPQNWNIYTHREFATCVQTNAEDCAMKNPSDSSKQK